MRSVWERGRGGTGERWGGDDRIAQVSLVSLSNNGSRCEMGFRMDVDFVVPFLLYKSNFSFALRYVMYAAGQPLG